eukprot:2303334-Pyramimonas_sp.AAC.1
MSYQTQVDGGYYYDDSDTSDDDGKADAALFGRVEDEPDMSSWSNTIGPNITIKSTSAIAGSGDALWGKRH